MKAINSDFVEVLSRDSPPCLVFQTVGFSHDFVSAVTHALNSLSDHAGLQNEEKVNIESIETSHASHGPPRKERQASTSATDWKSLNFKLKGSGFCPLDLSYDGTPSDLLSVLPVIASANVRVESFLSS